ncbi:hypothetical protein RMR10_004680 [Agrobacterium rosae]|uniref:hypothetical protein n=1 Tax=Agrobacterium rosae TaxID=1972867 RepID=UPI002A130623|nr:hypothetical protein [Agrobacterium rosae]MDX8315582.1 hypothetical protein [Agrobacterium rosae]
MKRFAALIVALLAGGIANAQTSIDGSDRDFDAAVIRQVTAAMQPRNSIPRKVIVRGMKRTKVDPTSICGFVTVEDRFGTYPDFQPFVIYSDVFYLQGADICQ